MGGCLEQLGGLEVVMCTIDEEFLGDFGGYGEEDGKFIRPTSIALDSRQNIYVSDEWLQRTSKFDRKGQFLGKWGEVGSGYGQFNRPSGLAFDKEDNLYLTDSVNHRVLIFTREGSCLGKFGAEGSGEGHFTDWLNHRVQVFTPDFRFITALKGDATISKWAERTLRANPDYLRMYGLTREMSDLQRFCFPVAVDVDDHGRVIIADGARYRLQIYLKGEMLLEGYRG